jgi:hypothetical protein
MSIFFQLFQSVQLLLLHRDGSMNITYLRYCALFAFLIFFTTPVWAAAPTITSTSPTQNARNISVSANISITFDQPMNNATLTTSTIKVNGSMTGLIGGSFTYGTNSATFDPSSDFKPGEVVMVTVTTGVQNGSAEAMAEPYIWSFTTMANEATSAFQTKVDYTTANGPQQVIASDVDLDGFIDLVSASPGGNLISVLLNNGNGTFATKVDYATGAYANSVASGDFNSDGYPDLVTANYSDNSISVFMNDGDGTFATKVDYTTASGAYGAATADVDGDGDVDVVIASITTDAVSVFLNNGNGTFASATDHSCGNDPRSITVADVDNDGDVDAIVGRYIDNKISVVFNNGNGAFDSYTEYASEGYVYSVAAADVNGDGAMDILSSNINVSNKVSVFINNNNGNGTFASKVDYSIGGSPSSVTTADIDGDGDLDMAVAAGVVTNGQLSVLKNNGNGTFASKVDYTTGSIARSVVAADLNGTGTIDLAVANNFGNSVSVLMNVPVISVSSVSPTAHALTVSPTANVTATFNTNMNSSTMTSSTIFVRGSVSGPHTGSISYDGPSKTMTFNPTNDFARGEIVTVTLTTGIQTSGGTPLTNPESFSFTVASGGTGPGFFETQVVSSYYTNSNAPSRFLSADIDNDGDVDMIGFDYYNGITLSSNNGDGSFAAPVNESDWGKNFGSNPRAVQYSDMDNDGYGDIVATRTNNSTYIVILKNNGTGTFSRYDSVNTSSANVYYGTEAKDFNNDGKNDIAYVKSAIDSVFISYNSSGWTNNDSYSFPTHSGTRLTSGDIDNDGDVDLVIGYEGGFGTLSNNGDETFGSEAGYSSTYNTYYLEQIMLSDVNGDGYLDVITTGGNNYNQFGINLNNGDGTFGSESAYTLSIQPAIMVAGDLDADGDIDLAFCYQNETYLNVAYNNGSGVFNQQALFSDRMPAFTMMDFDGDGDLDIVGKDYSSNVNLRILQNTPPSTPTTSASGVTFSNNFGTQIKVSWTNGNGTNRIAVMKQGGAVDWTPSDNTTYTANASFGSGTEMGTGNYIVYNGTSNNVTVTSLSLSTTYHVAVFEYNGTSGIEKYKMSDPGTGSEQTNSVEGYPFDTTAGYALNYDGRWNQTNNSFSIVDSFTVELWAKPTTIGSEMVILVHGNDNMWIGINAAGNFTGLLWDDDIEDDVTITGTATAVVNQWYHLALTGKTGEPLKLYVNGVLDATSGSNIGSVSISSNVFYPGGDYNNASYRGMIDELRLWSSVRLESEIRANMHKTLSGIPANLSGYWQFNEGTGNSSAEIVNNNTMVNYDDLLWVTSDVPVGGGTSTSTSVPANTTGTQTIGNVELNMTDGFDVPTDVVVSEVTVPPNTFPTNYTSSVGDKYFIIDAFPHPDSGSFSTSLTLTYGPGKITDPDPFIYILYKRGSTSTGTWTSHGPASSVDTATGEITWTNITSFSQVIVVNENFVVPIQLASFTASLVPEGVMLEWMTVTETNNYGFYVERRAENEPIFSELPKSFVAGAGTTLEEQHYSWTDENVIDGTYYYRLKQVDLNGDFTYSNEIIVVVGLTDVIEAAPREFSLKQNYPNPFNPSTTIKFSVEHTEQVILKVYNMLGQEVATLFNGIAEAGRYYRVIFDASQFGSGLYIYHIVTDSRMDVKKMVLLK